MSKDNIHPNTFTPLTTEQFSHLTELLKTVDNQQAVWMAGFIAAWVTKPITEFTASKPEALAASVQEPEILTILYGSVTGKGEELSAKIEEKALQLGFEVVRKNMSNFSTRDLASIKNLVVVLSTHGNGAPAQPAKELYNFLFHKKAPQLSALKYAVLALGDSSYPEFCKAGIDVDKQLEKLGANRLTPTHLGDYNVSETAPEWIAETLSLFDQEKRNALKTIQGSSIGAFTDNSTAPSKTNPFSAPILEKVGLHGRDSDRQTIHLEVDITNSGLTYQPGDSVGVLPLNPTELIEEVLKVAGLNGSEKLTFNQKERTLVDFLRDSVELSKVTPDVINRYKEVNTSIEFQHFCSDKASISSYVTNRDVVDLLTDFPVEFLEPKVLLSLLRPLQPRLYSISSSPLETPNELHLTVGVIAFNKNGRNRKGACSTYLSEAKIDDEHIPIFIEANPQFKLPSDASLPIIMIGAGTGIAPYRSFVQHRLHAENPGKSWLFFGNRNFESEFLYQTEWQKHLKNGALTRMDVAFSRDTESKIYVQDRLYEKAFEVYQWIQEGAYIYLCGNRIGLTTDVQKTLIKIVSEQGNLSFDDAEIFLNELQTNGRYQLDVY